MWLELWFDEHMTTTTYQITTETGEQFIEKCNGNTIGATKAMERRITERLGGRCIEWMFGNTYRAGEVTFTVGRVA